MSKKRADRREPAQTRAYVFSTAWGWCGVKVSRRGLVRVVIPGVYGREELRRMLGAASTGEQPAVVKSLCDYFAGKRPSFDVPLDLAGHTDFERAVYREVARLPYGRTASYGEIARRVGRPGAARAVGTAMARNPVPIVVPCHRVIRSDGGLGGFSLRGGTAMKQKLLALERQRT